MGDVTMNYSRGPQTGGAARSKTGVLAAPASSSDGLDFSGDLDFGLPYLISPESSADYFDDYAAGLQRDSASFSSPSSSVPLTQQKTAGRRGVAQTKHKSGSPSTTSAHTVFDASSPPTIVSGDAGFRNDLSGRKRARGGEVLPAGGAVFSPQDFGHVPEDKVEQRRAWNRSNAKKSRERKKFLLASLTDRIRELLWENRQMHQFIHVNGKEDDYTRLDTASAATAFSAMPDYLKKLAPQTPSNTPSAEAPAPSPSTSETKAPSAAEPAPIVKPLALSQTDFSFIELVSRCKRHFIITDPLAPDNPIVFASQGFYELTGYTPDEILGYNCRFLQGKDTDPRVIAKMRRELDAGVDVHVVVRNYTKAGEPFWNELFMAPLRDASGRVVHFVGIQSSVPDDHAAKLLALQEAELVKEGYGKAK